MYTDQARLVFQFDYQGAARFADPLALRRRLIRAANGQLDHILREAAKALPGEEGWEIPEGAIPPVADANGMPAATGTIDPLQFRHPGLDLQREEYRQRRYEVICEAFGVPAFDPSTGKGTTEAEALDLLASFWDYLEGKEKAAGNLPPSSQPIDSTPADSTTATTSASS